MNYKFGCVLVAALLAGLLVSCGEEQATDGEAAGYTVDWLVPPSHFQGIHGLAFDADDNLYAGSVLGQRIYKVDPDSGEVEVFIDRPEGMADDLEFGPDGTLYYTSISVGALRARAPDGTIRIIADGLPGTNSVALNAEGRLFMGQVFQADVMNEVNPETGEVRIINEGVGGPNGFDFGPDGYWYGPLWFKGQIVRVDVESGEITPIVEGLSIPAAANFDSKGNLYALDTHEGHLLRIDISDGSYEVVATLDPALDNLAIDSNDRVFVTNMADNAIYEINTETGEARTVVKGQLSVPADIDIGMEGNREVLYLADVFALRKIDVQTGEVTLLGRVHHDEIEYPVSISARHGVLHLASFGGPIQVIDAITGERLDTIGGVALVSDVISGADGAVYALDPIEGRLVRIATASEAGVTTVADGLEGPFSLTAGLANDVYISEALAGQISHVDLDTGERTVIATGLAQPEGLDVLADGRIVVAEVGARAVSIVDPATGAIERIAENLEIGLPAAGPVPEPNLMTGVAVSYTGEIFVTSDLRTAIYRLTPPAE